MKILVTGAAGFIGFHTTQRLLDQGAEVVGLDNLNDYYEVGLKEARLGQLEDRDGFHFVRQDVADRDATAKLFSELRPQRVVHLAAQAGVRYSVSHPHEYVESNLVGFANILEGCRHNKVEHLVYASSSSVYGANTQMPFSVNHCVDHPLSLYAATKKANELMAHTYSHLYDLPTTGLRFFTVYGPWGRPDMAYFLFTQAIDRGKPIDVFNNGKMLRDLTYIDDVVEGVVRTCDHVARASPGWGSAYPGRGAGKAPYRIYNIGTHRPVELMRLIGLIEEKLGKEAKKNFLPMQPGDVPATYADVEDLSREVGFKPSTSIETGIGRFVDWYREYYGEEEVTAGGKPEERVEQVRRARKKRRPVRRAAFAK